MSLSVASTSAWAPSQMMAPTRAGRVTEDDDKNVADPSRKTGKRAQGNGQDKDEAQIAQEVQQLKARDREVRAHEQAHMSAGAGLITSGAHYTYETGPDGRRYAVGGEVGISLAEGRTPQDTIARAQQIRSAALAPAQPSGQDMAVAAKASQMEMQARMQLMLQQRYGQEGSAANDEQAGGSRLNVVA